MEVPPLARTRPRPRSDGAQTLPLIAEHCPECRPLLWAAYDNFRTVTTLDRVLCLTLYRHRCPNPDCSRIHQPYRPEAAPPFALPQHEFGLDVLAVVGRLRHAEHRRVPEIHHDLTQRGVVLAQRTVTNLLSARPWPRRCPVCPTRGATSMPGVRPPSRSRRPTGTRKRR